MSYYIGADLGTSALKLLLMDESGNIIKTVTRSYEVSYPNPGWSEQSPKDWWDAFSEGVKELRDAVSSDEIKGIGVAGQMHGLVVLDKNDEAIRPVILWNDGRTHKENDYLNTVIGKKRLAELTANISFAGFTAPKLLWLWENERENFERTEKVMLPKDYINYRLTGVHACDYSDASGMLLLDVKNRRWSAEMLDICHLSNKQMPKLFESYEPIGTLLPEVSKKLGLSEDVIVAAGAGDNAGAAIGTGTAGDGKCNISLGTSGTIFISSEKFRIGENNALHAFCHADGAYHLMGCILSAASCNQWFCEKILGTKDYDALQKEICEECFGRGDVFFLPYLMGERCPCNDTDATGVFLGLRPDTDRGEMLLAVLEGVSFAIRENLELAKELGINIKSSTVSGGGAKSKQWMKILSNVLGIELCIPETEEGPSLGAAFLAAAAHAGDIKSFTSKPPKIRERILPDAEISSRYEEKFRRYTKIYPNMKNLFKEMREN